MQLAALETERVQVQSVLGSSVEEEGKQSTQQFTDEKPDGETEQQSSSFNHSLAHAAPLEGLDLRKIGKGGVQFS